MEVDNGKELYTNGYEELYQVYHMEQELRADRGVILLVEKILHLKGKTDKH